MTQVDETTDTDYVVVTLDDVFAMWGDGATREEAIMDLAASIGYFYSTLNARRDSLAPPLAEDLRFLDALRDALSLN